MSDQKGDGVALYSTRSPLNITQEMTLAGVSAHAKLCGYEGPKEIVEAIYTAMSDAAPPEPEDISEDALETVEAEFYLPDEVVEAFAMRCVETDMGRPLNVALEHWRQFVRDLAKAVADTPFRLRLHSGGNSVLDNGEKA